MTKTQIEQIINKQQFFADTLQWNLGLRHLSNTVTSPLQSPLLSTR